MNLLPFNKKSYQRLVELGYKYLLLRKLNPRYFEDVDHYTDVQILEAVKHPDDLAKEDNFEPIESEKIAAILHQREVVSFVIVSEK